MSSRVFEAFCETMDQLPVKAILRAAEAQRRMIADDLALRRNVPEADAQSIASFCDFLTAASGGHSVSCPALPLEHCPYYRKIVQRLVEAGELPFGAQDQFDEHFSEELFKALTSPA